jgi:transposase-like protein
MNENTNDLADRQKAIHLYSEGVSIREICHALNRTRPWLYKWLQRYKQGGPNWYADHSRTPHCIANKTAAETEIHICFIRRYLENTETHRIGAKAIAKEMKKRGMASVPLWTVNRILKRNHLSGSTKPENRKKRSRKRNYSHHFRQLELFD